MPEVDLVDLGVEILVLDPANEGARVVRDLHGLSILLVLDFRPLAVAALEDLLDSLEDLVLVSHYREWHGDLCPEDRGLPLLALKKLEVRTLGLPEELATGFGVVVRAALGVPALERGLRA